MSNMLLFFCCSILWLVVVFVGAGLVLYMTALNIQKLTVDFPVTVNVKVNFKDRLDFPAVTICNQNSIRSVNLLAFKSGT